MVFYQNYVGFLGIMKEERKGGEAYFFDRLTPENLSNAI